MLIIVQLHFSPYVHISIIFICRNRGESYTFLNTLSYSVPSFSLDLQMRILGQPKLSRPLATKYVYVGVLGLPLIRNLNKRWDIVNLNPSD